MLQLPRFWCEAVMLAQGTLHPDYRAEGPFDAIVFEELQLDAEEVREFISQNLPDLPTFERWIPDQKGGQLDPDAVELINARIRNAEPDAGTRRAILEFNSIHDDGSIRDALSLCDLDDWGEFHRVLTSGHELNDAGTVVTGGCHCGDVRWRGSEAPWSRHICHGENCRRGASTAYVPWFSFHTDRFEFLKGEPAAYRYEREEGYWAERGFCPRCASLLTYTNDEREDSLDVTICTADDPDAFPPESHEWTSEKLSWVELWDLRA